MDYIRIVEDELLLQSRMQMRILTEYTPNGGMQNVTQKNKRSVVSSKRS